MEHGELTEKFNTLSEAKNISDKIEKEYDMLQNDKESLIKENQNLKKLNDILNKHNKSLLYENNMNKNKKDMISITNKENKYEKYLSNNIEELTNKLNNIAKENIDYENKINILTEEKETLDKQINEYNEILNETNNYIEELENYIQKYENKNDLNKMNVLNMKKSMELNRKNSYIGLQRIKSNASLSNKKQKSLINLNLSNNMIIDDDENIISQKNEEIKKLNQAYSDLEKKNFEINLELKNEKNKYDTVTKEKNDLIEEKNKILKEKNELGITNIAK